MAFSNRLLLLAINLWFRVGLGIATEEDEVTCQTQVSDASKVSASLLQKASLREEKSAIAVDPRPCTGVQAQGKCWYLSELGETCASTCSKNGLAFSYILADNDNPIIPQLMKWSDPTDLPLATDGMRQPLAPLECLGRDKVHFHPASKDAAINFIGDMSAWNHESCQLACPCGEAGQCKWKQPAACAPEFEWKGSLYVGCPTVDRDGPWCMHHHQHSGKDGFDESDWSYCVYSCASDGYTYARDNGCFWKPAPSCTAQFDYEGTRYLGCTAADHHTPWCSNSDPYAGSWNHCQYVCPDKDVSNDTLNTDKDKQVCSWQPSSNCSKSFSYKGIDHIGCTVEDNPTPWCSFDRIHNGMWSECARVCTVASDTTPTSIFTPIAGAVAPPEESPPESPPTLAPTQPPPPVAVTTATTTRYIDHSTLKVIAAWEGMPCERHPDTENDYLGLEATLDEEGYQLCTMADSPINMKRFICRVVHKIGCRVTSYAALVGFVPYYSGAVSEQTYAHLEDELKILCHGRGKWVEPITAD
jgi:hypothetical protein